jgi:hypothetical protein
MMGLSEGPSEMNRLDDLNLSHEEGEALIQRLETQTVTAEDLQVLAQVVRLYFWLLFALKETKESRQNNLSVYSLGVRV